MDEHVTDAVGKGATLVSGGERLTGEAYDAGTFFAPTVLTDVTPEMLIYREETFGPIAPVILFDDEDEFIKMANDTEYGLAGPTSSQRSRTCPAPSWSAWRCASPSWGSTTSTPPPRRSPVRAA